MCLVVAGKGRFPTSRYSFADPLLRSDENIEELDNSMQDMLKVGDAKEVEEQEIRL